MTEPFVEIVDIESLDRFLTKSNNGPVIILKHSDSCGVSSRAYAEMGKLQHPVGLITVQKARAVSDRLEERLGVAHETPQVLIVRDGKLIWTTSHLQVRVDAVEAALEEVGRRQQAEGSR